MRCRAGAVVCGEQLIALPGVRQTRAFSVMTEVVARNRFASKNAAVPELNFTTLTTKDLYPNASALKFIQPSVANFTGMNAFKS